MNRIFRKGFKSIVWLGILFSFPGVVAAERVGELTIINPTIYEVDLEVYVNDDLWRFIELDPFDGKSVSFSEIDEDDSAIKIKLTRKKKRDDIFDANALAKSDPATRIRYFSYLQENLCVSRARTADLPFFSSGQPNEATIDDDLPKRLLKRVAVNMAAEIVAGMVVEKIVKVGKKVASKIDFEQKCRNLAPDVSCAIDNGLERLSLFCFDASESSANALRSIHAKVRGVSLEDYDKWYRSSAWKASLEYTAKRPEIKSYVQKRLNLAYGGFGSGGTEYTEMPAHLGDKRLTWYEIVLIEDLFSAIDILRYADKKIGDFANLKATEKLSEACKLKIAMALSNFAFDLKNNDKMWHRVKRNMNKTIFLSALEGL